MPAFTAAEQALIDVWDAHTASEFAHKDADAAIDTMTDHPVLIHVPVGTGATGREPLRRFYRDIFILYRSTVMRHRVADSCGGAER